MLTRRHVLRTGIAAPMLPWLPASAAEPEVAALLRRGGAVIAFRHALAPGTFDPPNFQLGVCSTQRNLSDEGRAQACRIGAWFQAQGLKPARVRSSPWCRCVDTANLAFGAADVWPALGSPRGYSEATNEQSVRELRRSLVAATAQQGRFEVWVTHMFVLSALTGENSSSGEGLVLRAGASGAPQVIARLSPA